VINILKRLVQSSQTVYSAALSVYMATAFRTHARAYAAAAGLSCRISGQRIEVRRGMRVLRSHIRHSVYVFDMIDHFEYYFDAVDPELINGCYVVDYSEPKFHWVKGYDLHHIFFTSIAEPVLTTKQYLSFAELTEDCVVIDLGAYSGLTSIMFRENCGSQGRVIAVEADPANIHAARKNFALYAKATCFAIDLVAGAIWSHNDGLAFSGEGSMGSSATEIIGERMTGLVRVPSFTLSAIASRFALDRVDFIKCDVEGAESVIFADDPFFERYRPRIIVEVHNTNGEMTTGAVESALKRYGYSVREINQEGVGLPLLECRPPSS
jgi:FkbM family methyltransferase